MNSRKLETYFICILDFEATCEDGSPNHEVIEFPSVLYKWDTTYQGKTVISSECQKLSEFQQFVKPKNDPVVSEFCYNLTRITQEQVDGGISFPEALQAHYSWLQEHIPDLENEFRKVFIMTCGNWDMETMAPVEFRIHNMRRRSIPDIYMRFINIKMEMQDFINTSSALEPFINASCGSKKNKKNKRRINSLDSMIEFFQMTFVGQPHSGIDDCRNIGLIFERMVEYGYSLELARAVQFVHYCDTKNITKAVEQSGLDVVFEG